MATVSNSSVSASRPSVATSPVACPKCAQSGVSPLTTTTYSVHFGCPACREVWSIPERRKTRRLNSRKSGL
jgi:predicted RNA-binding Zn-ribbon protein involved in translation (DUF1610 family)